VSHRTFPFRVDLVSSSWIAETSESFRPSPGGPGRYDSGNTDFPPLFRGRRRMTAATTAESTPATGRPVYVKPPAPKNRLGPGWFNHVMALVGLPWQRRLAWGALQVPRVRYLEDKYDALTKEELRPAGLKLRGRARGGESLDRLLPEAFALVCVAAKRTTQMRPFDVQVAAGGVMHRGGLAELATGE